MTDTLPPSVAPSREKLADAILSSALDCIIVADTHGRIVEFNQAAETTFGWSRADILYRTMDDTIVPHRHRHAHRSGMERYLSGGQARVIGRRVEVEGMHASGRVFPVELSITETMMDGNIFFVATLRDISAKVQTATELQQARASLQAIFDSIPAAVYLRDRDDRLVMINAWGSRFLDRDPATMIGQKMSKFRQPDHMDRVRKADASIVESGKPETHEFTYRFPGGDRHGLMTFFPVFNAEREVSHIGGILIDVSELYSARRELDEARSLLESVFDNIPAELYLRELDGSFIMMNKWGADFYHSNKEGMRGRSAAEFDSGDEIEIARQAQQTLLATGKPVVQTYHYTVAGRNVVVSNTIFPVRDTEGRITRIGGFTTDVTELHTARENMQLAQATLQSFVDQAPFGIYVNRLGPDGIGDQIVEFTNDNMCKPYGLLARDFIGKNPFEVVRDEAFVQAARASDSGIVSTRRPEQSERQNPYSGRFESYTRFPILDQNGKVTHIGGMRVDIDEKVRATRQLDEVKALLESIFDNVPVVLYVRELDGRLVTINRWGGQVFGVDDPAPLIGLLANPQDTPERAEAARKAQEQLLASGQPVTQESRHRAGDRDIVMLNSIFPIRDTDNRIVRIGGFATDVTELHEARTKLQQAQESLHQSEKLAALGQLLAGVAHELNNPLAVVLGRAALLQEKLAETPHAASLQKLRDAAHRCARIVKTFLAMARQTGPRRDLIEINELIEMALEMTSYGLQSSDITWSVTPLTQSLQIEGDHDQMVQVLINLILNAQHAVADRPAPRIVDVRAVPSPDRTWMEIVVADNGPGVPDTIAHRIFDPFFTTKAVGQGTGLGLSVCKSMVEAHGGTLTLETTPGGGATFRVRLPGGSSVSAEGPGQPAAAQQPTGGRILVVDDEAEIAATLADCLTPLGIDCVIATDAASALLRQAEDRFDGVFCDISMPGMDGIAFYSALQAANPTLSARLVFVSGNVLHRDWEAAKNIDRPVVEKPFDPQQIRDAALRLLAQKESRT